MVASTDAGFHMRCSSDTKFTPAAAGGGDAAPRDKGMAVESSMQHAKCECCGLLEECTAAYMDRVRSLFCSRFICGLCAEAVKEEEWRLMRAKVQDPVAVADALHRHMAVCAQFSCSVRENPAVHLRTAAAAMRQLLLRRIQSSSGASKSGLPRTSTCLPTIGRSFSSQT